MLCIYVHLCLCVWHSEKKGEIKCDATWYSHILIQSKQKAIIVVAFVIMIISLTTKIFSSFSCFLLCLSVKRKIKFFLGSLYVLRFLLVSSVKKHCRWWCFLVYRPPSLYIFFLLYTRHDPSYNTFVYLFFWSFFVFMGVLCTVGGGFAVNIIIDYHDPSIYQSHFTTHSTTEQALLAVLLQVESI